MGRVQNVIKKSDIVIVGAGVVGLSVALEIINRNPTCKITVIEKEDFPGFHASGRNSGVLHAGFYYTPDSLKAKFCRNGNIAWHEYCEKNNLHVLKCGKVVVAKNEHESQLIDELYNRSVVNNVPARIINENELKEIEPRAKTYKKALYSPTTSSVDPKELMNSLHQNALMQGVSVLTGVKFISPVKDGVLTSVGVISSGYTVNTGGLYADKIAKEFGLCNHHEIIPFKGLYLHSPDPPNSLRLHVYPVPNLLNPFLGVHYTILSDNKIEIGPTAIPAFWRENYNAFERFSIEEAVSIMFREFIMFIENDFNFRSLAVQEVMKYFKSVMVKQASLLVSDNKNSSLWKWGKPGIRAQLYNKVEKRLEMDFVIENNATSLHVLNAVSPAFTCAFPIASYVSDIMVKLNILRR